MKKAEIVKPNPKSTINSYRSFGYNLPTAIADIVDNSISALADKICIEYKWLGRDSYIIISDNGKGMNRDELVLAMTPGSKDPEAQRDEKDLGRFGMGLKTASFSQCKRLTCVTKQLNYATIKRCWDIDFIIVKMNGSCLMRFLMNHLLKELIIKNPEHLFCGRS